MKKLLCFLFACLVSSVGFSQGVYISPGVEIYRGPKPSFKCGQEWPDADAPNYYWKANGCGSDDFFGRIIPDKLFAGRVSLKGSCMRHDRCYMTVGKKRAECDYEFKADLHTACRDDIPAESWNIPARSMRQVCWRSVDIYFWAVRDQGSPVFTRAQTEQRKFEECVADHGYHKPSGPEYFRTQTSPGRPGIIPPGYKGPIMAPVEENHAVMPGSPSAIEMAFNDLPYPVRLKTYPDDFILNRLRSQKKDHRDFVPMVRPEIAEFQSRGPAHRKILEQEFGIKNTTDPSDSPYLEQFKAAEEKAINFRLQHLESGFFESEKDFEDRLYEDRNHNFTTNP